MYIGVRDYIHVVDLAKGHIAAMKKFKDNCGLQVFIKNFSKIFVIILFFVILRYITLVRVKVIQY